MLGPLYTEHQEPHLLIVKKEDTHRPPVFSSLLPNSMAFIANTFSSLRVEERTPKLCRISHTCLCRGMAVRRGPVIGHIGVFVEAKGSRVPCVQRTEAPLSCLAAHGFSHHQAKQNFVDRALPKIQVNPTQISGQMNHPVDINVSELDRA